MAITYDYFSKYRDHQIQFLLGPRGGDGANQSQYLKQEFKEKSFLGPNYSVSTSNTNGYLDIYRQISVDRDGTLVGFTMDGYEEGPSDSVRTILPLDWEYLHFVWRPNVVQNKNQPIPSNKAGTSPASSTATVTKVDGPMQLSEWAARVRGDMGKTSSGDSPKQYRIYLGPVDSGTRLVAQAVLRRVRIDPKDVEAIGIADFQEMLVKLHQGEINGAFYLGPCGANAIEEACKDEDCILVSIDEEITKSLSGAYPFLQESKLPAHLYSSIKNDAQSQGDVTTLATRRVLVASTAMPAVDAYHIAQHVQEVFSKHVAFPVDSEQKFAGPNLTSEVTTLRYKPHAGAAVDPARPAPPTWLDRNIFWIAPLAVAIALSMLNEVKPTIAKWLESHRPGMGKVDKTPPAVAPKDPVAGAVQASPEVEAKPVVEPIAKVVDIPAKPVETNGQMLVETESSHNFAAPGESQVEVIAREIEHVLGEMHHLGDELFATGSMFPQELTQHWRLQIVAIHDAVIAAQRNKSISDKEADELLRGARDLRRELAVAMSLPWNQKPVKPRRKTNASPPETALSTTDL
ncbi:MAG: TAXI family TRAP transporter solute-binding subunit [Pirellulales bacterium]